MLQFGDMNFLCDDLMYKGGNMIMLVFDVLVVEEDILLFWLMCDYVKLLFEWIGVCVVDDLCWLLLELMLFVIEQ